jgi:hypothetical protein
MKLFNKINIKMYREFLNLIREHIHNHQEKLKFQILKLIIRILKL